MSLAGIFCSFPPSTRWTRLTGDYSPIFQFSSIGRVTGRDLAVGFGRSERLRFFLHDRFIRNYHYAIKCGHVCNIIVYKNNQFCDDSVTLKRIKSVTISSIPLCTVYYNVMQVIFCYNENIQWNCLNINYLYLN